MPWPISNRFFLSLFLILFNMHLSAKMIAFSFDDGLNPQKNANATQINQQILNSLQQQNIQSIIFPSIIKIGDFQGKQLIYAWGEQGHLIGNHSALHQNLNHDDITLPAYLNSIQTADIILKDLPNYQRIYRFPFLKEGNTIEKRDSVKAWLKDHQYTVGAVSIDASDWFYNQKYLQFQHDPEKLENLKQAYIEHLLGRAHYYDDLAQKVLHRSPKHVLLLHVNAINAAYLTAIITAFKQQNWQIISAQEAFQDSLYQVYSQNMPAGESIIWSIAKSQGETNLRYPAEDAPYEKDNLIRHHLD